MLAYAAEQRMSESLCLTLKQLTAGDIGNEENSARLKKVLRYSWFRHVASSAPTSVVQQTDKSHVSNREKHFYANQDSLSNDLNYFPHSFSISEGSIHFDQQWFFVLVGGTILASHVCKEIFS
jgi:hypothetical protein